LSAFSGFLSFLLIVAVAGMFAVQWGIQKLKEPGPLTADKVVNIPPSDIGDITAQLEHEGVIEDAFLFDAALTIEGKRPKIQRGEYFFKQNASLRDVIDTLASGKQVLHPITLPEGLTSEQIVQRLAEADVLGGDVRDIPKEGSLLPETYKVTRGTSRSDLVKKMQDDQRKVVDQIWARRASDLPLRSPYELIILASIVEKETGKADERPRVAGVFLNRLQKHMRLQSDPTIVYGLVGGKGSLGHPISRAELDKSTPYNTYIIEGLPPGPIANPGRAALEAVANPSRTQELYFVADGTGGHVFADTLDQHARNVQRWRQIEKDAKDKVGPDVDKGGLPLATPRPGQRGDISNGWSVYGDLPGSLDNSVASFAEPSLQMTPAQASASQLAPLPATTATAVGALQSETAPQAKKQVARSAKPLSGFDLGQSIDSLALVIPGPNGRESAADLLDGPATPVQAAELSPSLTSIPVPSTQLNSAQRAAQKPEGHPAGLDPGSDQLPLKPAAGQSLEPLSTTTVASGKQVAHPPIYDASEGTPLDPLLDKTYDLNYAKTVPPQPK
jgi:UPF0755 protein